MFLAKKSKELLESNQFGKQTSNAIAVGCFFTYVHFIDESGQEFDINGLFDYLFDDDIKFLADSIDGSLTRINRLGQIEKVSEFQALVTVCDPYGLIIRI